MGKIFKKLDGLFFNFLIPLLFTIGILSISLSFFGFDVKGSFADVFKGIPFIGDQFFSKDETSVAQSKETESELDRLSKALKEEEEKYKELKQKNEQNEQELTQLKLEQEQQENSVESESSGSNPYKKLSKVYQEMSPKKAAAILDQLEKKEAALLLAEMSTSQQSELLAKMPPEKASELSTLLLDEND